MLVRLSCVIRDLCFDSVYLSTCVWIDYQFVLVLCEFWSIRCFCLSFTFISLHQPSIFHRHFYLIMCFTFFVIDWWKKNFVRTAQLCGESLTALCCRKFNPKFPKSFLKKSFVIEDGCKSFREYYSFLLLFGALEHCEYNLAGQKLLCTSLHLFLYCNVLYMLSKVRLLREWVIYFKR